MSEQRNGGPDEPVGSVAEEAAKLLGALSGWAKDHGDGWSNLGDGMQEHLANGSPECTWCPICRAVGAVRHTSPEVTAHLANAASSLMLAVSAMMAPHPDQRAAGVERIDLDESSSGEWAGEWKDDE